MMANRTAWSNDEIKALKLYYGQYGGRWDEWKTLLNHRSESSIYACAKRLGLTHEKKPSNPPLNSFIPGEDPYEEYILACLRGGMTTSQVDKKMKWTPGKARLVLTTRWKRYNT